mmetsp:Transcript_347/g.772  ORF Transcript_347/g.772 Transcript_347/m.772 type:complete len:229 (+) Transcript_347:1152-1838(+)
MVWCRLMPWPPLLRTCAPQSRYVTGGCRAASACSLAFVIAMGRVYMLGQLYARRMGGISPHGSSPMTTILDRQREWWCSVAAMSATFLAMRSATSSALAGVSSTDLGFVSSQSFMPISTTITLGMVPCGNSPVERRWSKCAARSPADPRRTASLFRATSRSHTCLAPGTLGSLPRSPRPLPRNSVMESPSMTISGVTCRRGSTRRSSAVLLTHFALSLGSPASAGNRR